MGIPTLAGRPKRRRVRAIIVIIVAKTIDKLDAEIDGSVFELTDINLARVQKMLLNHESTWSTEMSDAYMAFESLAAFIETGSKGIDEGELATHNDALGAALDATAF